jgi:hypothetical protein
MAEGQISNLAKLTAEDPNESLLSELRVLEKKMGLVLTLVSNFISEIYSGLMISSNQQYLEYW